MKPIEIEVLSPQAASAAFVETWRRAESGELVTPRLAFGSYAELFAVLSEKRFELLRHVAVHAGLNTRQLAISLARDYKNVHTDVKVLLDLGLLEKGSDDTLSAPYDEIIIRAELTRVA